MKNNR